MSAIELVQRRPAALAWERRVRTRTWTVSLAGYAVIALFAAGFGGWAMTAPLSGAAIAPGVVAAAGQNVMIQHLEGGIISELLVHEGDRVRAGEPLLILDATPARAQLNREINRLIALEVQAASLQAWRDGKTDFEAPVFDDLPEANAFDVGKLVGEHRKEFAARLARYNAERSILQQRVDALGEAVIGLEARKKANEEQLQIIREEAVRKKGLLDKGLTNRSEYTELLRTEAELVGQIGSIQSQIATSSIQQIEAMQQIERLMTSRVEQAVSDLNKARAEIRDVREQVKAARDVVERTVVRAPVDGIIVRSVYNARGAVVRPGEAIFEILPTTRDLIVDARVAPRDISAVKRGQEAKLRFPALNTRITPEVPGTVTYVSADRQVDQKSGQSFYVVRLRLADPLPKDFRPDQIYPGMPVEAFIETGERTFVEYLVRPILDSFARAFREQ